MSRVFHLKLREFIKEVKEVFGEAVYYVSVVEWQARGLYLAKTQHPSKSWQK